jgi:Kef-type K+ transport system membrane component KefB
VLVPIGLAAAAAPFFGYSLEQSLFIGIVLAATSVSISAQTLMELGVLRSREGTILLGAAVIDDVLAIAILSIFVAFDVSGAGALATSVWTIIRMLLFLVGASWLGVRFLPKIASWVSRLPVSQSIVSFAVVCALIFAWSSEVIGGVAAITGAFIAGVAFSISSTKTEIERGVRVLNYAFFVPIFLVGIGLTANARDLSATDIAFALVLTVAAILAKLIGAGIGARLGGTTWREALRIGVGMVSRGEVGLIVAGVGVNSGLIGADIFTVMVIMVLATTLATPPLLRWAFRSAGTNGSIRVDR